MAAYQKEGMVAAEINAILFLNLPNGIERYLGDTLSPLVGTNYPVALRCVVSLPWDCEYRETVIYRAIF